MKISHRFAGNLYAKFSLTLFLFGFFIPASSQLTADYPDSIRIPVTFYDFHSDSSNPEFEISPSGAAIKLHMVADTLLPDTTITTTAAGPETLVVMKPVVGTAPYFNRRVDRWFREWKPGDFQIYNYATEYPTGRGTRYSTYPAGQITLPYDTSFKNIKIEDTLTFKLTNALTGTYEFSNNQFFPLDGKGFGNEGRAHNYSFAMELHSDFTKMQGLKFQFTGDDDVWAFVNGKLVMDLGGIHSAQTGTINLDEIPNLTENKKYNFDFFYVERHVTQSSIVITTNILTPKVVFKLSIANDTVCPSTRTEIAAIASDDIHGSRQDLAKNTVWRIIKSDVQANDTLQKAFGDTAIFVPRIAYSHVQIEGAMFTGSDTLRDTAYIYIGPCEAYKISIESKPVNLSDTNALRYSQDLPSVEIIDNQTTAEVYAVARDISGAYVRMTDSILTQWSITPDGVAFASVQGESNKKYHGIITRTGLEGNTYAVAAETGLLSDSVLVKIIPYYFVRLQLRTKQGAIIDTIKLETDSTGQYFVYGLKSTCIDNPDGEGCWVRTNAKWELQSSSILLESPLPEDADSGVVAPKYPGTGNIHFSKTDPRTEQLDVPAVIVASPPSHVEINILTPQPRTAGVPIQFIVKIYNTDTLVAGTYCFGQDGNDTAQASYSDRLGVGGGNRPYPRLTVDGVDTLLNVLNQDVFKVDQCFENGIDTITTILYYAPFEPPNDSFHQVSVILGNDPRLKASSELFSLQANDLAEIRIEDAKRVLLPPQILTGSQSVTAYADGYDDWGNVKGFIVSNWTSTETLSPVTDSSLFHYVTAEGVPTDQSGSLCASQYNLKHELIQGCLHIDIIGPKKVVSSALTRDLDGNGLLDAIEFTINRAITSDEISFQNFTDVWHANTHFIPSSITFPQGDTNVFLIHFAELDTAVPQTGWALYYNIVNATTIANTTQRAVTTDGAGPVVWKAEGSITKHTIKVYLSENIKNVNNNVLDNYDNPFLIFNSYYRLGDSLHVSDMIDTSCNSFIDVHISNTSDAAVFNINNNTLTFYHKKDFVLTNNLYMNFKSGDIAKIQDYSKNQPHINNIKRHVDLVDEDHKMVIGPNPTSPSINWKNPGIFTLENDTAAIKIAKNGQGTIIQVTFTPDPTMPMSATMKIHDMVGNLVWSVHVPDYLAYLKEKGINQPENSSMLTCNIYWNGYNQQKMKVSPGIYRAIFTLNYRNAIYPDIKMIDVVGIKK